MTCAACGPRRERGDARPIDLAKPNLYISKYLRNKRMDICRSCEFFIKAGSRCQKCGCFMKAKTYLGNASCPVGKWGQEEPTTRNKDDK